MNPGLISAIVLNWNGKDVIVACIESLLTQTYSSYEIIVVDNGSADGSLEMIRSRYAGKIKLIENRANLGFAEGCNVGIRAAQGEFIALVNSDSVLSANWMEEKSFPPGQPKCCPRPFTRAWPPASAHNPHPGDVEHEQCV